MKSDPQTTIPKEQKIGMLKACLQDIRRLDHPAGCEGGPYDCPGCALEGRLEDLLEDAENA